MRKKGTNKYKLINTLLLAVSFIVRLVYILITSVGERQHDLGYATSLHDDIINPGHLGYVEYIAKFHHLPDFDPFSIFSYYHPPLHHIVASLFLNAADMLGIKEPGVYEVIQIPTFIYSCITIYVSYKVLKLICKDDRKITIGFALIAFHPGLIYMTGSINNDMMALMFTVLCVYTTILWFQNEYRLKYLIYMALCMGFGLIAKPNIVIMVVPMGLVMLMHMYDMYKAGEFGKVFGHYCIFAAISGPIGLSWTIRNAIRFGTKPGIPSPSPNQCVSGYSLFNRLVLPSSSCISFPFYSENATYNNNMWQICFKTSLFAEIWPTEISPIGLRLCQLLFISAVILGIYCAVMSIVKPIRLIKQNDKVMGIFLLSGYVSVILMFYFFVLKYPFTCSCNFRYVGISLLYSAIALIPYTRLNTD